MYSPRIVSAQKATGFVPSLPEALEATARLYVIVEPGWFLGRLWRTGEVLVCGLEDAVLSGPVVLEARGLGRPRPGLVKGTQLYGDSGEPCSGARWRVAGALRAVLRPARVGEQFPASDLTPAGWVMESVAGLVQRTRQPEVAAAEQLPLFSQAA